MVLKIIFNILFLLIISSTTLAAPDGKRLYSRNCAACHGNDGMGGVGVPLALPGFIESVSDRYLFRTIRHGRPGRVMPAFSDLSDAQVEAIVNVIRNWSGKPAPVFLQTKIKGDVKKGKDLFKQHCTACHGMTGEGGTGTGVTFSRPRKLPIIAPAINNPGFLSSASDEMIRQTLIKGRLGTPMNSYRGNGLKEDDINDLVTYVRSFERHHPVKKAAKITDYLSYESSENMEDTLIAVKRAIRGSNFKLIRIQKFEKGFVKEGQEDAKKVIVYFCNFNMLDRALKIDPRVGLFLPCRITLLEQNGKVQMTSINPSAMSKKFDNDELNKLCAQMTRMYKDILEEASL
ncbi:MAG TPA: c-type cytochrome [Gammaproteobacteria bacterium]|nr:c-type cytochrome [Gammaproteobacteria bacterium]